jgi:hypothetical protein
MRSKVEGFYGSFNNVCRNLRLEFCTSIAGESLHYKLRFFFAIVFRNQELLLEK